MFLIVLAGTLVIGGGLFAAAGGELLAWKSAAQAIGWLLAFATLVALQGLRSAPWERITATAIAFFCGAALLYVSYFEWGGAPAVAIPIAAAATVPDRPAALPAPIATPAAPAPVKRVVATRVQSAVPEDACFSLEGIEFLQCHRCAETTGLRRIACNERTRLEYCENRPDDARTCTSAIPDSPPA